MVNRSDCSVISQISPLSPFFKLKSSVIFFPLEKKLRVSKFINGEIRRKAKNSMGNSINSKLSYPLRSALRSKEGKPPVPDFSASSVPRRYVDDEPTDNALRFYKWFTEYLMHTISI